MIVDGFAGPGGWSEGLRLLGLREVGIEWDESACATARAAGHERVQGDMALLDPLEFPCVGFIGSPPCPSFSAAGSRDGLGDIGHVVACADELAQGRDTRDSHRALCADERSILTVEPLRWVLALMPEWVALEQVPAVLPIWQHFARILEARGYSVWTGVLEAERYGVPQTRERAILMASRVKRVLPPRATHQRYVPGEPQRHDFTLEGEVLPWVSMAEALGWGATARPYPTVACSSTTGGPDMEKVGGSGARRQLYEEQASGRWEVRTSFGEPHRGKAAGSPVPEFDRWQVKPGEEWAAERPATAVMGDPRIAPPGYRGGKADYEKGIAPDSMFTPKALKGDDWPEKRPATTIAGDPRVFQPGGHHANDGRVSNAEDDGRSRNAIRVSIEEAAVLQSFRPDYPWQGNKSETFRQVGNAVPPLLARAILAELV